MKKILLGATLALGLLAGSNMPGHAAGDGLDRNAAATGNSTFAGQHRVARRSSMMAKRRVIRHRHRRMR